MRRLALVALLILLLVPSLASAQLLTGNLAIGTGGGVSSIIAGSGISVDHATGAVTVTNTGTATPGGAANAVQFNNAGAFGGFGKWDNTTKSFLLLPTTSANGPFSMSGALGQSVGNPFNRPDDTYSLGYNVCAGNACLANEGAVAYVWESSFFNGSVDTIEHYLNYSGNTVGVGGGRLWSFSVNKVTGQLIGYQFNADQITFNKSDATTMLAQFNNGQFVFPNGTALTIPLAMTNGAGLFGGGVGTLGMAAAGYHAASVFNGTEVGLGLPVDGVLGWFPALPTTTAPDTTLARVSAGVLAMKSFYGAAHVNEFQVYGDASKYASLKHDATNAVLSTQATGGGIIVSPGGTAILKADLTSLHLETQGTAPTVGNTSANSCGTTAAAIVGTDHAGKVTVGATAGTSCTVTFAKTWTNAPPCNVTNETTANLSRATSTTTTVILAGTFVAGDVLAYQCMGRS